MPKRIEKPSKRTKKVELSKKIQKLPIKTSSSSRRGKAPSFAESAALLEAALKTHSGGNGIPGGRKFSDVVMFKRLPTQKRKAALISIINKSEEFRARRKSGEKIDNKDFSLENNRQVVYPNQFPNTAHSLHVGQDIASVFNSNKKGGSRVYDYDSLTKKLDKRLESNKSTHGNNSGAYFDSSVKMTVEQRRAKIAQGLQDRLKETGDQGVKRFSEAGLTQRGQKWVDKLSTIMYAEKAREDKGGSKSGLVNTALGHVGSNSFNTVFVTKRSEMAPFAGKGGAKVFKD